MNERRSFLDRIIGVWHDIAGTGSTNHRVQADLSGNDDLTSLRDRMQECLDGRGGEVSARARAASLGRTYLQLDPTGRERFLEVLAKEFGPDPQAIDDAVQRLEAASPEDREAAEENLRSALEPPRLRLLTQFNALPEGVKFLVDLRADVISLRRNGALQTLNRDLQRLLASWFDVGFLELRRLTWESPAALLEKLIAYEAVHEIRSWEDLKNRLDSDRRLFAFFHPRMPDEPLIFVQVALVNGLAGTITELLDQNAPVVQPDEADTAIFYSISNAQRGLVGISFGGFLIKRVVDVLTATYPGLKTFATLSPIPGFCDWLGEGLDGEAAALVSEAESASLGAAFGVANGVAALRVLLEGEPWTDDPKRVQALQPVLTRICAHYLLREKRGAKRARDPVAHFHLTNGARVERLNWLGDPSPQGLKRSAGLMVNYRYDLNRIEDNHERYTGEGRVAAAGTVNRLLKK